jgi:HEXXH motif-containing protein
VLARRRPLAGAEDEFLALEAGLAALAPELRERVLGDPYAQFWNRLAFELTQAVLQGRELPRAAEGYARELGTREPARLLADHLAQFKRFALSAAWLAGASLELRSPLVARLPLALPGAAAACEGSGEVSIRGVAGGRLLAAEAALEPARCPLARGAGVELPLQPHAWHVPGLGWSPPAGVSDLAFQAGRAPFVSRALELVARHDPVTFAQLPALLRLVAVNPIAPEQELNYASLSDFPGAFVMLALDLPHVLGAAFVHESHHNRLFCLEELEPILADARLGTQDDAVHYSPWREEPRPLRGLLHAVYVAIPEGRYWLDVSRRGDDEAMRRYAASRCARTSAMLGLGVRQLLRIGRFTPAGREIVAALADAARAAAAELREHADPRRTPVWDVAFDSSLRAAMASDGRTPVTARDRIVEHVARFDRRREIPEAWLAELALA